MRLSTAIATGRVTIDKLTAMDLEGCVLGMAANAAGIPREYGCIRREWPWLREPAGVCPKCQLKTFAGDLLSIVYHLFDAHVIRRKDLSLDELIDIVRSIEPAEPEQLSTDQAFCDETEAKVRA